MFFIRHLKWGKYTVKKFDVVSLGEILIDFTQKSVKDLEFTANPGGAPCNVLAQLSRLGKKTAFLGKVGHDQFGSFLENTLICHNINTDGVVATDEAFTTLAFVGLDSQGNRSFSFVRNNSADVLLSKDEVRYDIIAEGKIFHCGSLSLTHSCSDAATVSALEFAASLGLLISVDPNIRLKLWKNPNDAAKTVDYLFKMADIIKLSDYEISFLYGQEDILTSIKHIFSDYRPKILFLTCGSNGAYISTDRNTYHIPCLKNINTVDTTGAGDSFCGAALSKLLDYSLDFNSLNEDSYVDILRFANAAANISTTCYGAVPSMPASETIESVLMNNSIKVTKIV